MIGALAATLALVPMAAPVAPAPAAPAPAAAAIALDDGDRRYLAENAIACAQTAAPLTTSLDDPRWAALGPARVVLHVQRTLALNDADANANIPAHPPVPVEVRALYDGADVAVRLEWRDETLDRASDDPRDFGDAVALETPMTFGAGERLPYIGMGDEEEPVFVDIVRAVAAGSRGREFVAAGFGSLTPAHASSRPATGTGGSGPAASSRAARMAMRYDGARRTWSAVIVRPLDGAGQWKRAGVVPIAFAAWNGAWRERGGNKALSSWKVLRLEGAAPEARPARPARGGAPSSSDGALDARYVHELGFGWHDGDLGDAARGKILVESVCVACHRMPGKAMALAGMAPDLSDVGAIATPGYLRDSVIDPSLVVLPNINVNRHANHDLYSWSNVEASGKRISKMPSFASLAPADVAAIVAFLRTLGADAPPSPPATSPGSPP